MVDQEGVEASAIRSGAWFFKNVRHACDGRRRCRRMYFDTVACHTIKPSFSSSPNEGTPDLDAPVVPQAIGKPVDTYQRFVLMENRKGLVVCGRLFCPTSYSDWKVAVVMAAKSRLPCSA